MKRLNDGTWINFETKIGEANYSDTNGKRTVTVSTDGEFWRVVEIEQSTAKMGDHYLGGLTPSAARRLAGLLIKAADAAEQEEQRLKEQDALIEA